MNILAIDSSTEVLSLALSTQDGMRHIEIDAGSKHSELVMVWVDRLFESAGIQPTDLNLVACMKGPGSFTGLRIGYAAAKGLSLALGIPVVAVPTLDCIAESFSIWPGLVLPVLDAKKGCFFAALYRDGNRLTEYLDAEPETLLSVLKTHCGSDPSAERAHASEGSPPVENVLVTGAGAKLFASEMEKSALPCSILVDPHCSRGRAPELLKLAEKLNNSKTYEDINAGPLYIRKSDAELNLKN